MRRRRPWTVNGVIGGGGVIDLEGVDGGFEAFERRDIVMLGSKGQMPVLAKALRMFFSVKL